MRQPSGTSWRATAAPCTPPPTPHWSIPSKSTPRWRTRSRKPDARRPAFSTRSDQCPAGSRTSPGSASPPDSQSADPRTKNRSSNGFPPVTLLDLDVDWGLGHEEDDENLRPAPPARARAVHRGRGPRAGSASHTPPFEQREHFSVGEFQPVRRSGSVRGPPGTALRLLQVRPTFAVLFAPLAYLPFALTFLCWTLLNGLLLWYALDRLLPEREATVALALLYLEVLLALQYGQSNALVAALMVLAFVAFEARRPVGAAVSITLGAAVKLFPLAALSVAVFHPRRLRSPPSSSRYSPPPSLCRSWPSRPATCWRSTARGTPSRRRTRCAAGTRSCTTRMRGSEWTGPTGRCRPPALLSCCSRSRCAGTAGRASSSGACFCARCSSTRSCSITRRNPRRSWSHTRGS